MACGLLYQFLPRDLAVLLSNNLLARQLQSSPTSIRGKAPSSSGMLKSELTRFPVGVGEGRLGAGH